MSYQKVFPSKQYDFEYTVDSLYPNFIHATVFIHKNERIGSLKLHSVYGVSINDIILEKYHLDIGEISAELWNIRKLIQEQNQ